MMRCIKCGATSALVLAGVHGGASGPGCAYYVCLKHVGSEIDRHRDLCSRCNRTDPCDIAADLRAALRAMARLMPDPREWP